MYGRFRCLKEGDGNDHGNDKWSNVQRADSNDMNMHGEVMQAACRLKEWHASLPDFVTFSSTS